MDNSSTVKQWIAFDFGPPSKKRKTNVTEKVSKTIRKTIIPKSFNFHEKLVPNCIGDLAVHPKKIVEVEEWFKWNVCQSQKSEISPFLLLSGPTGSGKTATVNAVCKNLNIYQAEWINPMDQDYEYRGMNQIDYFLEFLIESKYQSLFQVSMKQITVVKDFPNAVIQNPEQFFDILEACKYKTRQPVIFICTEVNITTLNLQRTLFPEEIIRKFNITHISFNPVAPTLMKNAIRRAQELVKDHCDIFKQPSPKTIQAIITAADGDIRSAMNQFYLASLKGTEDLPVTKTKKEGGTKRKNSIESVKSLMIKDETLGLFHGLGRVLNPKRKVVGNSWRLEHNIETLIDEFSIQPHIFTSFLFENYLKYFGDIVDVSKAAEILSSSVKLLESWQDRHETMVFSLWISVLGLMIFNEHKVSKWTQIRAPYKIKNNTTQNPWEDVGLNPTDYYYYSIIKHSDSVHKFKCDF